MNTVEEAGMQYEKVEFVAGMPPYPSNR